MYKEKFFPGEQPYKKEGEKIKPEVEIEEIVKKLEASPKSGEIWERYLNSAENILSRFELKPKEDLLIVTDFGVIKNNPELIKAISEKTQEKMKETKGYFSIMVAPEVQKSAVPFLETIGDKMKGRAILLLTSLSRSHSEEIVEALHLEEKIIQKIREKWQPPELKKLKTIKEGWSGISTEKLEKLIEEGIEGAELEEYKEFCKKRRSRIISIPRADNPEICTSKAALEDPETLREKAERLQALMENIEKVIITSPQGTNLELFPKTEYVEIDNGMVTEPGEAINFPNGEWSCAIKLKGTKGTLIIDGPCGEGLDSSFMGAGIRLEIEDGLITEIKGVKEIEGKEILENLSKTNEKAKSLKEILEGKDLKAQFEAIIDPEIIDLWKDLSQEEKENLKSYLAAKRLYFSLERVNQEYRKKHPEDEKANAFKLAELGIGTNAKAAEEELSSISLIAEKTYGTIHIATGKNGIFGVLKKDPDYNAIPIHCDMILSQPALECFDKKENRFKLIDSGKAIEY